MGETRAKRSHSQPRLRAAHTPHILQGRESRMEEQNDWEELIKSVAEQLTDQLRREYYQHYLQKARTLSSPSEKLVYIYLALFQPQTLSTLRRGLALHENTVIKALRNLREGGHIQRDEEYLWWIKQIN